MRLVAAGVSYRAAPLRVRERAAASVADAAPLLRYLIGHAGLTGAAVLSTCNRTEFYLTCPAEAVEEVAPRLARYLDQSDRDGLSEHMVARYDADAAAHLFRVAAGLESMVVGEAQVLGQLKDCHRVAREAGTLDARLDFVLRRAISVGKRVRTETVLGRRAGSLSEAALEVGAHVLGDLRRRGVLLIGAGSMSRLAAERLQELGCAVFCASRSESATTLAASVGGRAVRIDRIDEVAEHVDFVLASTSSADVVLDVATVQRMQHARMHRPLCIVDIAMPRDVDAAAAEVPGVTLVDIDALGERLNTGPLPHVRAAARAEQIIASELEIAMRALEERDVVTPTIAALLARAERVRRQEVERTLTRLPGLDETARERVEAMTKSMVRKLLHAPIAHLRETKDDPAVALTVREAFDLES